MQISSEFTLMQEYGEKLYTASKTGFLSIKLF